MLLAALVVEQGAALDRLLELRHVEAPHHRRGVDRRRRHRELQQVERRPRVTVGKPGDRREGFRGDVGVERAQPALAILERAAQDALDGLLGQPVQHEHLGARQQRRVHLERGVFGGRADEDDVAGFDPRQERVLLRLVEAVDLVHEDDGAPAGALPPVLRRGHHLLDLLDAGEHRAEGHEARLRQLRDHARQGGLARPRRPPQDDRLEHVPFDRETQRRARREDVLLADDVVERARAHPLGQRRSARGRARFGRREALVLGIAEQTAHDERGSALDPPARCRRAA